MTYEERTRWLIIAWSQVRILLGPLLYVHHAAIFLGRVQIAWFGCKSALKAKN
jgi:hypothetical protein